VPRAPSHSAVDTASLQLARRNVEVLPSGRDWISLPVPALTSPDPGPPRAAGPISQCTLSHGPMRAFQASQGRGQHRSAAPQKEPDFRSRRHLLARCRDILRRPTRHQGFPRRGTRRRATHAHALPSSARRPPHHPQTCPPSSSLSFAGLLPGSTRKAACFLTASVTRTWTWPLCSGPRLVLATSAARRARAGVQTARWRLQARPATEPQPLFRHPAPNTRTLLVYNRLQEAVRKDAERL